MVAIRKRANHFKIGIPIAACFVLLLCSVLRCGVIVSVAAVAVFCVLIFYIVWEYFDFLLKYLPFIFGIVSNVLAVAVCEFERTYLSELQCYSDFEGSLPLIAFSRSLCLLILLLLELRRGRTDCGFRREWKLGKAAKTLLGISCFVVMVIAFALLAKVLNQPSFLYGYDRFQYAAMLTGIWALMAAYMPYLIVIPIIGIRFGYKKTGAVTTAIYCLFLFWIGTKFSTFFTLLCYFLLAFNDKFVNVSNTKKRKMIGAVLAALALMIGLSVFAYSASGHSSEGFLESRLAQQGQLWWKTYSLVDGSAHIDNAQLAVEADAFFKDKSIADSVGSRNGIYGVMYLCAPSDLVSMRISLGSRYTEAGYAMAYILFGNIGPVLFAALMACLIFVVQNGLALCLREGKVVAGVCAALLAGYVSLASSMFLFSQFFAPLGITAAGVVFMSWLLSMNRRKRVTGCEIA